MSYRDYNKAIKAAWVGKKLQYEGEVYTVVDVDHNNALIIDKPGKFTETTALCFPCEVGKYLVPGEKYGI